MNDTASPYRTLNEIFLDRTKLEYRSLPYLYHKPHRDEPYRGMNNGEFADAVRAFAAGLYSLGIRRGDRIALISESRPEWIITDFASLALGTITVPMFPTLTQKQVEQILAHSGASVAVVSNDLQLGKVIKSLPNSPDLKTIIVMNDKWNDVPANIPVRSFSVISKTTSELSFDEEISEANPDDVITIIYTSGTTGIPKGVMLTHKNILSNIEGALANIPIVGASDLFLSFLPLSHSFERIALYLAFYSGAQMAFAESIDRVADNMLEVRPTIMTGVPRFFERIYGRLMRMRKEMPPTRRKIFDWALSVGTECAKALEGGHPKPSAVLKRPIADALVFKKIRARTGGRIRFFVSGGAALPAEVGRAFAAFGMVVLEGYGLTETSPVIAVTGSDKIKWGYVGRKIPNIEVMIASDGEILTKGDCVMKGYYRSPMETDEMIDSEGWLHTGDVGELDSDGFLKITDRKKHLFVSSGGKNIAPAPIEALLLASPLVEQIMLIGDKRHYISALIVPEFSELRDRLPQELQTLSDDELCKHADIHELIEKEISPLQFELATYERVRKFVLLPEPFSIENGMLTPTLKVKRKEAEARYTEVIESLYKEWR